MRSVHSAVLAFGMLWGASAQATPVYDQAGTTLDIYGRIAMGISGGGTEFDSAGNQVDNGVDFQDVYSRLGFRMQHMITDDISAFGRLEWRFKGDERHTDKGFSEIRQSYIGMKSQRYGTLQAGNFDSLYYQFVSAPFDVYLDRGLLFNSSAIQSRGDSVGYYTPSLNGFTSFIQLKHYSERGLSVEEQRHEGNVVAAQGGIQYKQGPLTIGFGAVDDKVRGNGNGEMLYGLMGAYAVTDQLTTRLGVETQDSSTTYGGGFETVGLGGTYVSGPWAFTADYYHVKRDNEANSNVWAAGTYYKVTSAFDVFLELADGDTPRLDNASDLSEDVYWLTGARYHF
ncbi:MAG: porin [Vreelandella alkaliphila]|uniref:porin n=1 Tax=Halomonadaceae TaxID=28256 RepID=UPI000E8A81A1|nr:porin [Halomonas sp. 3A7M]HBP40970.1 porin [Halomonas sp.]